MTSQLLNNVEHHDLRVITRAEATLGDGVNQIMLVPTEFEAAQRDFPIILRPDSEGKLRPVAVLGLAVGENLYLDGQGGWRSAHIPLLLQRGPFAIASPEEGGDPKVLIDPDHPRISRTEGTAIFLPHGGQSHFLTRMTSILETLYIGNGLLDPLVASLETNGLLRALDLELRTAEGEAQVISNAITVDRAKLAALPGSKLEDLNQQGFLQSAFMIAASLANFQKLVEWQAARKMSVDAG